MIEEREIKGGRERQGKRGEKEEREKIVARSEKERNKGVREGKTTT